MGTEPEHNLQNLPKIEETEVGDGLAGNVQTIKKMREVARIRSNDPLIRKLALNILEQAQVPSNFYLDEALAIGDYVKNKVRYVRDPADAEYLQDPLDLVKQIQNGLAQGDCDDMSLLAATLLLSVGHEPSFRAVRYQDNSGAYNHIYVVEYERNEQGPIQRVVIDCILKNQQIGSEVPHVSGEEYPIMK